MLCLPTPTQCCLLHAALDPDLAEGYAQFRRWQEATDFRGHLPKSEIRLLPMVWHLHQAALRANPVGERLGGLYKKSFYNNSRLFAQLPRVVEALESRGVGYAFTKGVALHAWLYDGSGTRPMNDMDVLVDHADFNAALDVLAALGYRPQQRPVVLKDYATGQVHACTLRHETLKDLDLHYAPAVLHNRRLTNVPFLAQSEVKTVRGVAVRVLQPEALLFHLLVNYQIAEDWHWIADAVGLFRRYPVVLERLRPLVAQTNLYHATGQQLRVLWEEFGVGTPEEVAFYAAQPASFPDRCLVTSRHVLDLRSRLVWVAGCEGLLGEPRLTPRLVGRAARWYGRALLATSPRTSARKSLALLREAVGLG